MSQKERVSKIVSLDCKKHIKIYALNKIGLSNQEVADALGTNTGHVYNALQLYKKKPSYKKIADNIGSKGAVAKKETAKKAPAKKVAKAKAKATPTKAKSKAPAKRNLGLSNKEVGEALATNPVKVKATVKAKAKPQAKKKAPVKAKTKAPAPAKAEEPTTEVAETIAEEMGGKENLLSDALIVAEVTEGNGNDREDEL